jgi:hypothetical protein
VIGVNSSIFSRSGGSEGLGFAIPIDRARNVVLDLIDDGVVRRPWTGLELEPADPNRFGRSRQVRVSNVAPGSPADRAGLQQGRSSSVGRHPIRTPLDWEAALLEVRVGDEIGWRWARRVARGGRGPTDLPSLTAERVSALEEFELVTLTPAIRSERGLTSERAPSSWACPTTCVDSWGSGRATSSSPSTATPCGPRRRRPTCCSGSSRSRGACASGCSSSAAGREFYVSFSL